MVCLALLDDSFAVLGPDLRSEFGLGYLRSTGDRAGVRDVDVATLVAHLEHESRVVLGLGLLDIQSVSLHFPPGMRL